MRGSPGRLSKHRAFRPGLGAKKELSLRICTDIGIKKSTSLPATKSLKETYAQDRAEVRALGQLTGDCLQTTSWHSSDSQ